VFENRDEGIPHNVHFFSGADASGEDLAATAIEAGAGGQTLALGDLAPGAYFYQCDVHPSQMTGTLTVS
jgi:plastocyanin